jgi:rhodanese-related sulfurtransferase
MDRELSPEADLTLRFFEAKAAAYASPMTIMEWRRAGKSDFLLVDVRKRQPRPKKQIAGSIWFPEPEIGERLAELPKDKLIVLYCWDTWCSLATSAAVTLLKNGYPVKELFGGIAAWEALHLPEIDMNPDGLATGRG